MRIIKPYYASEICVFRGLLIFAIHAKICPFSCIRPGHRPESLGKVVLILDFLEGSCRVLLPGFARTEDQTLESNYPTKKGVVNLPGFASGIVMRQVLESSLLQTIPEASCYLRQCLLASFASKRCWYYYYRFLQTSTLFWYDHRTIQV